MLTRPLKHALVWGGALTLVGILSLVNQFLEPGVWVWVLMFDVATLGTLVLHLTDRSDWAMPLATYIAWAIAPSWPKKQIRSIVGRDEDVLFLRLDRRGERTMRTPLSYRHLLSLCALTFLLLVGLPSGASTAGQRDQPKVVTERTVALPTESSATARALHSVSVISTNFGYAVGENGTILSRENGQPWQAMSSPTTQVLRSVSMTSSAFGYAVGENGTILSRENGQPWQAMSSPTTQVLHSVSDRGWVAVGENGTILSQFKDLSFVPWYVETSPTTSTLYSVSMIGSDCGAAAGANGTIISRCYGEPWQMETSPTTRTLYSVAVASVDFGKAVGEGGVILSRADGQPWQLDATPTTHTLHSVIVVADDGYWAVGEGGTILHYPFYGPSHDTWQVLASPTTETLFSISGSRGYKWAVGACGMILNNYNDTRIWQIQTPPLCEKSWLPIVLRR